MVNEFYSIVIFCNEKHLKSFFRYQDDNDVKMIVLLGEVGGTEEYDVCEAFKNKRITKPLIAWCIGTFEYFLTEIS